MLLAVKKERQKKTPISLPSSAREEEYTWCECAWFVWLVWTLRLVSLFAQADDLGLPWQRRETRDGFLTAYHCRVAVPGSTENVTG